MNREFSGGRKSFNNSHRRDSAPRGNDFGAPREMHKATCSECGEECEVPFKPTAGKPVFCRACFQKRKPKRF